MIYNLKKNFGHISDIPCVAVGRRPTALINIQFNKRPAPTIISLVKVNTVRALVNAMGKLQEDARKSYPL